MEHIIELAKRAHFTGKTQFTRFLDPATERQVELLSRENGVKVRFFGGTENSERRMAAFYTDEEPLNTDYPLTALEISWSAKYCTVGHRDLLGAVMGLGLARETTGDIVFSEKEGAAYLFATDEIAEYIIGSLESAGRAKLNVRYAAEIKTKPPEITAVRVTVATLRLDSIVAAGYKLSRSEAQRLIQSGLVKVNHIEEMRSDIKLVEGDLLSVRGYGRMKVDTIQGETKKGRLGVMLFRYEIKHQ